MSCTARTLCLGLLFCTAASAQHGLGLLYQENLPGGMFDAIEIINTNTGLGHDSCLGVARTPNGHYFVSTRKTFNSIFHQYYEFDASGQFVASYSQPIAILSDPHGTLDLALDGGDGPDSRIWAGLTGSILLPFDWQTGTFDVAGIVTLTDYFGNTVASLTLAQANGETIFISADSCPPSNANEVHTPGSPVNYHLLDGSLFQEITADPSPLVKVPTQGCRPELVPEGKYGAAFDAHSETVWWHVDVRESNPNPNGSMTRFFATDPSGRAKGMVFQGDRSIGGVAGGCEFYEDSFGNGVLVYLVGDDPTRRRRGNRVVEVYGRFDFGDGCSGSIDFDSECFIGNENWAIDLIDVPPGSADTALLWRGQAQVPPLFPAIPGISSCGLSISLLADLGTARVVAGKASRALPVPNSLSLVGAEVAFQWLVPGAPLPLPLSLSRAGSVRIATRF